MTTQNRAELQDSRDHLTVNNRFQSDRYPGVPEGKVPLSDKDAKAIAPLLIYAAEHAAEGTHDDEQFSWDVVDALIAQHGAWTVALRLDRLRFDCALISDPAARCMLHSFASHCVDFTHPMKK